MEGNTRPLKGIRRRSEGNRRQLGVTDGVWRVTDGSWG